MIVSRPTKAPLRINNTFEVSIEYESGLAIIVKILIGINNNPTYDKKVHSRPPTFKFRWPAPEGGCQSNFQWSDPLGRAYIHVPVAVQQRSV